MTAIFLQYLLVFHLYNHFFSLTQKLGNHLTPTVSFECFSVFCSLRFRFVNLTKTERINGIHLFQKTLSERTANGSCRTETARPKGTVVSILMSSSRGAKLGSLSNHDDDSYTNSTNLHIWQWKTVFLHALHVHFSSFDILKTFSFFLWREMTFFAVVWTTWAYNDKCSILSCPKRWFQFKSRIVKAHFSGIMTLNTWKMIADGNAKRQFQMTFSLPSTSCLLKLPTDNCLTNGQLARA